MKATCLFLTLVLTLVSVGIQAQDVELDIERSVKVEFNSEKGYSYNVYGTSDPAKKTGWKLLGGGDGTGENIVFFYRSETDQKVFFRVESEPSEPGEGPKPQEPQSIIPITGLAPAESSGTYNLGEAIGEKEIGGVYRIGVSAGTDGLVIELPHPGQKEYRQKQIKLSIYRGGTGLGSGKVSLKVPTLAGGEYETRKLVDNSSKQLTDEVVILPATALESGRKVIVDLFNDTTMTAGAAGGQWVVTTAAEAVEPTLAHRWEGTQLTLQNPDGTWGGWVNLEGPTGAGGPAGSKGDQGPVGEMGPKGDEGPQGPAGPVGSKGDHGAQGPIGERGLTGPQGPAGPRGIAGESAKIEYEWQGTNLRIKNDDGTWGDWADLVGPRGSKGLKGDLGDLGLIGKVDYEWDGTNLRFRNEDGSWDDWVNLVGPRGPKGESGSVITEGADISDLITRIKHLELFDINNQSEISYRDANLSGKILTQRNLTNADFTGADLSRANLSASNLSGADFTNSNLDYARLYDAIIDEKTKIDGKLKNVFEIQNARRLKIAKIVKPNSDLSNSDLSGTYLFQANFSGADLTGTILSNCNLYNANLKSANLSGATLSATVSDRVINPSTSAIYTWNPSSPVGTILVKADLSDSNLNKALLQNVNLTGADLTGANLSGADLTDAVLRRANLKNIITDETTKLDGKWLFIADIQTNGVEGKMLVGVDLSFAHLVGLNLQNTDLSSANLQYADLRGADLTGAKIEGAKFKYAVVDDSTRMDVKLKLMFELWVNPHAIQFLSNKDLSGLDLRDINLAGAKLINANLSGANLSELNLEKADLRGADLTAANLQYVTGLGTTIIDETTKIDDKWLLVRDLQRNGGANRALVNTDLSYTTLKYIYFSGSNLAGSNFEGAALQNVVFRGAKLAGSNFEGAALQNVWFSGSNLAGSNFKGAQLQSITMYGGNLSGANFSDAHLIGSPNSINIAYSPGSAPSFNDGKGGVFPGVGPEGGAIDPSAAGGAGGAVGQGGGLGGVGAGQGYGYSPTVLFSPTVQLYFSGVNFSGAKFVNTEFENVVIDNSNMTYCDFSWAVVKPYLPSPQSNPFPSSRFSKVNFGNSKFMNAHLEGADFQYSWFKDSKIDETTGIDQKWRMVFEIQNNRGAEGDYSGKDLSYANLRKSDLSAADLTEANLTGADLIGADLSEAKLDFSILKDLILDSTTRIDPKWILVSDIVTKGRVEQNLASTDLSNAYLRGVDWRGSTLTKVDFSNSKIGDGHFMPSLYSYDSYNPYYYPIGTGSSRRGAGSRGAGSSGPRDGVYPPPTTTTTTGWVRLY